MKNRKNIVSLLVVLILMVSTVVLFTGCDHYYQQKLIGVWEVKRIVSDEGTTDYPVELFGSVYAYVYFTADGKFGMASKIVSPFNPSASGLRKTGSEVEYTIKGNKIVIKKGSTEEGGTFKLTGKKLILKGTYNGKETTTEAEKTTSPSLDDIKKAKIK